MSSGRPLVVYTGNVQAAKGLSSVLALAARVPEVDFLIVGGKAADRTRLLQTLDGLGLPNVTSIGWRPASELGPFMYAADVLIIPPTAGPLQIHGRTVLPMKVFSYLAAGRPILAPALPDIAEVLSDGVNARLVPPDDPDAAAAALRGLLADPDGARALALRARQTAAGLTWDARAARLVETYTRWLKQTSWRPRRQPAPQATR